MKQVKPEHIQVKRMFDPIAMEWVYTAIYADEELEPLILTAAYVVANTMDQIQNRIESWLVRQADIINGDIKE